MPFTLDIISLLTGGAVGITLGIGLGFALGYAPQVRRAATLEADNKTLHEKLAANAENLDAVERRFALQFENLANRIFDEKSGTFKKTSEESLNTLLNPLKEKLQEFQRKVEDSSKEQFSLKNEIKNIVLMNEKMTVQTESLTRALKGDVKAQGNWGEIILEKILEDSGLRKGKDYILQGAEMGLRHVEDNTVLKPDVIVMLPEDKHIIIDAKVSLTAYERFCAATDDAGRALNLKDYINSIRQHVTGLEQRRYQDTQKLGTPDFVLMFMPIEGAYSLAMQQDAGLHSFAWDKKIVIVCPSTLFATLKTIASVWRLEMQNENALEIARQGGNLYDKIAGFFDDMQDIGTKLGNTQKVYDEAFKKLSTGSGNILKRTEDLKKLGIKTSKKLPKGLSVDEDDVENPLKIAENG